MGDEKFRLNKTNIIILFVDIVIFILVIISIVLLVNSFKDESELPTLEVTRERTSTSHERTTTEETTTTTTTTTRRNLSSPYYEVNVDSILTDELITKASVTNAEALEIMKKLYGVVDKIINTSDNSLLDIETTIEYAKDGERDSITYDDSKYGIIYNGGTLLKKCFSNYFMNNEIGKYRINTKRLFLKRGDDYYRIENKLGDVKIEVIDFVITNKTTSSISANMRYYKSNYKELGYSSPVYQLMSFSATYEVGRWKIVEIDYPLAD